MTPEAQTITLREALERYREEKTIDKAGRRAGISTHRSRA
jgi:hypothetical protein